MSKHLRTPVALLLLGLIPCGSAWAQDVSADAVATEAATDDVATKVQAAIDGYQATYDAFLKVWRAATEEERTELRESIPNPTDTAMLILELIKDEAGSDAQWTGLQWALQQGSRHPEVVEASLPTLLAYFPNKDEAGDLAFRMQAGPGVQAFLEKLVESTESTAVRGKAIYGLAGVLRTESQKASGTQAEELQARALMLFDSLSAAEYADVVLYRTTMLAEKAKGEAFAMKFLVTGKVAPDIEAEDIDGTVFKLSDYRGKVVMLDFWGDW
ncbi:MAG: putative outer membrane protein [Planctomycetota bacterium]|jgi:predicted outer membrane protein